MADQILIEMSRTLGRFDQRFDSQDESLLRIESRLTALETLPGQRRRAFVKWLGGIAATVVAAALLVFLGVHR